MCLSLANGLSAMAPIPNSGPTTTMGSRSHATHADGPESCWSVKSQLRDIHDRVPVIIGFSANSPQAAEDLRQHLIQRLTADVEHSVVSFAQSAYCSAGRHEPIRKYRIAVYGMSNGELLDNLRTATIAVVPERPRRIIFLFTGQGRQFSGMGAMLYRAFPTFRDAVDRCQQTLVSWGFAGMLPYILGTPDGEGGNTTEAEMTAMFALEYGLVVLWNAWGIRANMVLGQRWVLPSS